MKSGNHPYETVSYVQIIIFGVSRRWAVLHLLSVIICIHRTGRTGYIYVVIVKASSRLASESATVLFGRLIITRVGWLVRQGVRDGSGRFKSLSAWVALQMLVLRRGNIK